jgi:hypothetical protein
MGRIYRQARFVVAWLGEPTDDSDLAFQLLHIAADARAAGKGKSSTSWLLAHKYMLCEYDSLEPSSVSVGGEPFNRAWLSLLNLVQGPYVRRLWTFQEIVLPCTVYLLCGTKLCHWDDMSWLFEWIMDCQLHPRPPFMDMGIWNTLANSDYVLGLGFRFISAILRTRRHCHESDDIQASPVIVAFLHGAHIK